MIVHVVLSFLCISDTVNDSDGWRRGYLTFAILISVNSQIYDYLRTLDHVNVYSLHFSILQ